MSMDRAPIRLSLHASAEPPALRVLVQQYADRCSHARADLFAKHANLIEKKASNKARCDEDIAAAGAAAEANVTALRMLLRLAPPPPGIVAATEHPGRPRAGEHASALALYDDAEQVLLHTARDWGAATGGATAALDAASGDGGVQQLALIRTCVASLPQRAESRPRSRVLVLGSGLGRTAFELAHEGCDVDAIDASIAMTLAATTMCERAVTLGSVNISLRCHPWLLRTTSLHSNAYRFRAVEAPAPVAARTVAAACSHAQDACEAPRLHFRHEQFPASSPTAGAPADGCNGVGGEAAGPFDGVLTDYYIDAVASDFTCLVTAIAGVLRPGGCWVNRGPLKWQQVPGKQQASFYSWEEVLALVEAEGLFHLETATTLEEEDYFPPAGGEMQREVYLPGLFVARRLSADSGGGGPLAHVAPAPCGGSVT